jgi:hypothetical protein
MSLNKIGRRSPLLRKILFALFCAIFLAGCSENPQKSEVENFVRNYCSVLQMAYETADFDILVPAATEKELKKVFPVIQALKATDNVMKTEILGFKIKKTKVSEDKATVRTHERWRYWWEERRSGTITKPKGEESYKLEYNLLKENGRWKVDFIRNLNE